MKIKDAIIVIDEQEKDYKRGMSGLRMIPMGRILHKKRTPSGIFRKKIH